MRPRHLLGSAVVLIGLGLVALDLQLARVERSWKAMVAATERARAEASMDEVMKRSLPSGLMLPAPVRCCQL